MLYFAYVYKHQRRRRRVVADNYLVRGTGPVYAVPTKFLFFFGRRPRSVSLVSRDDKTSDDNDGLKQKRHQLWLERRSRAIVTVLRYTCELLRQQKATPYYCAYHCEIKRCSLV